MNEIKCGLGAVDFTPRTGLPLMGNLRGKYESTGAHDPIMAVSIVFADSNGNKAALLSLDLCMINREQTAMMRKYIAGKSSIPENGILVNATHTHAGPAAMSLYGMPKAGEKDIEDFFKKACEAVFKAEADLKQAAFSIGYSEEHRVSFNRRLKNNQGKTLMNWESFNPETIAGPLGPIDPLLSVLSIEQKNNKGEIISGALVNFALHPAILDYENTRYSADYPGFLREGLNKIINEDFITFFGNGCCGNINHIDYSDNSAARRGYGAAERIGYMLAADTSRALRNATGLKGLEIAVSREYVPLKRLTVSKETYYKSLKILEESDREKGKDESDGLPEELQALVQIQMYEKQHQMDNVEVMVIRLGNLAIVGLPGEIFCELGMRIREESVSAHTIIIELANGAIGYIPDENGYGQGGYEDTPGSMNYVKGSGEKLAESALTQIKQLFAG